MNPIVKTLAQDFCDFDSSQFIRVLTITNSANEYKSYPTPIRISENIIVTGIVTSDLAEMRQVLKAISGNTDYIFIDIEKKIAPRFSHDILDSGSYYDVLAREFPDLNIRPIAPNSLTVRAALASVIKCKRQRKSISVGVVGLGNLGFKIALGAVEIGCDTFILPRKVGFRETSLENAINFAKTTGTIASARLVSSLEKLAVLSEVVILACPPSKIITHDNVFAFKDKVSIIDIGKGNVEDNQVADLHNLSWLDVGAELIKFIRGEIATEECQRNMASVKKDLPKKAKIFGNFADRNDTMFNFDGEKFYPFASIDNDMNYVRYSYRQIKERMRNYL